MKNRRTVRRNVDWQTSLRLFSAALPVRRRMRCCAPLTPHSWSPTTRRCITRSRAGSRIWCVPRANTGPTDGAQDRKMHHFAEAVRLNPEHIDATLNLGVAYSFNEEHEKAIEVRPWCRCTRLRPAQLYQLAYELAKKRPYNGSLGGLIFENIGRAQKALGKNFEAIKSLSECLRWGRARARCILTAPQPQRQ